MPNQNDQFEQVGPDRVSYNAGVSWSVFGWSARRAWDLRTYTSVTPGYTKVPKGKLQDLPYRRIDGQYTDPTQSVSAKQIRRSDGALLSQSLYSASAYGLGCNMNWEVEADSPYDVLASKINDEIQLQKANFGVSMAEIGKTASLVAGTATRLANTARALRKGHLRKAATYIGIEKRHQGTLEKRYRDKGYKSSKRDFAADSWLELSYGWKPLLKDVYDSAEALASMLVERDGQVREVKKRTKTSSGLFRNTPPPDTNTWRFIKKETDERWGEMCVRYKIPNPTSSFGQAFGLDNPMLVAWELVPFSFVADWFLPIGNWLEQLTAHNGLVFHSGYYSEKRLQQLTSSIIADRALVTQEYVFSCSGSATGERSLFVFDRSKLMTFPYTALKWKDPRSIPHAASAIALLHSIFLKER